MKILAFVDLHSKHGSPEYITHKKLLNYIKKLRQRAKKEKPDVVICAGDASLFENHLEEIMHKISKIGDRVLVIPGNHETDSSMRKICAKHDSLIYINKKTKKIGEYTFVGFSGEGFLKQDKEFEKFAKKIKPKIKGKKVVLVTHAPPYKTKLDKIGKEYCGNKSITNFIKTNKNILLEICGHIHENAGKQDKINNTKIINPGPLGKIIKI